MKDFLERQPYEVTLDGISMVVCKHVFPPDYGFTTRNMAKVLGRYSPKTALDMGCGSGFLALNLKRYGAKEVSAIDISARAVECTRKNIELNTHLKPIMTLQSNLFEKMTADVKFDLIVFNQPFFPASPDESVSGVPDGGYEIIKRFFTQACQWLNKDGVMIMSFQDSVDAIHDPKQVAEEMGLSVRVVFTDYYNLRFA